MMEIITADDLVVGDVVTVRAISGYKRRLVQKVWSTARSSRMRMVRVVWVVWDDPKPTPIEEAFSSGVVFNRYANFTDDTDWVVQYWNTSFERWHRFGRAVGSYTQAAQIADRYKERHVDWRIVQVRKLEFREVYTSDPT